MPFNHLILCCLLLLPPSIMSSIKVLSDESVLCIRWPKYWSFSFSISPSTEYSGLISCRMISFRTSSLQSKGLSVFYNTTVQKHQFFSAQLSFFNFILFFNFTILYWFCHISKWVCHRHTCVPHPEPSSLLPPHTIPAQLSLQLSHPYMTTGKTIALTRWTFVGKVMSLLINMLSRLVIT